MAELQLRPAMLRRAGRQRSQVSPFETIFNGKPFNVSQYETTLRGTTYFGHLVHCTLLLLFPPCSCMLAAAGTTYCQDHCTAWIGGPNLVSPGGPKILLRCGENGNDPVQWHTDDQTLIAARGRGGSTKRNSKRTFRGIVQRIHETIYEAIASFYFEL